MPTYRRASEPFREVRVRNMWEYDLNTLELLDAHFPLYFTHYLVPANRGRSLPPGWIKRNMVQLCDDFVDAAGVQSVLARNFLDRMNEDPQRRVWFAHRFKKIREVLGDHIISETRVSAARGQPGNNHPVRRAARQVALMENEEYEMDLMIRQGDFDQRAKDERDRERKHIVATSLAQVYNHNEYIDITALMNRILHLPIVFVSDLNVPFATHSLPFGKPTVFEALQHGLAHEPLLHFNFCITSRPENQEECHRYLSQNTANNNPTFSPTNPDHRGLTRNMLLKTDVRYTTICSYKANAGNGKDTLILALESQLQGVFHKKAPIGTLGFRYDKAGRPDYRWNDDEERVCSLMLVWSESKLLESVRDGELRINPTSTAGPPQFLSQYNHKIWDYESWVPVVLPVAN